MRIDLAKSILADTGKTGTAPQGVRENEKIQVTTSVHIQKHLVHTRPIS